METEQTNIFDGWETYPTTLSPTFPETDVEFYCRRLHEDSERLFSHNNTNICFETVTSSSTRQNLLGTSTPVLLEDSVIDDGDVGNVLQKHVETRGDHYIFLRQAHTWAPLQLSQTALRKIFTALDVHPGFLDILHTFGNPQQGHQSRGVGGYGVDVRYPATDAARGDWISEFFYKLRYMVKTDREGWPWSERAMGVYHQYSRQSKFSVWIIVQPTTAAMKLPKTPRSSVKRGFLATHRSLIHSTSNSWREYLEHLETEVGNDNRQVRLDGSLEPLEQGPSFRLAFSNVQRLQHTSELLRNALSVFESNTEILNGLNLLDAKTTRIHTSLEQQATPICLSPELSLSTFLMLRKWAKEILESARQTGVLITAYLNTSNSHALTANTASLNLVAEASKRDADVMLVLAKAAREDSRTVKLVTILAFIYLPATFVATIFSTGFVTTLLTDRAENVMHQSLIQGCTYMAVTIVLSFVTLLASYTWNRRMKLREDPTSSKP